MEGWSKKRLVEITEKIGSGATPRGGNDAYKESGISLFRSLNIHDGFFKEKNLAFIDEDQANKLSNVQVKEGDVLLNITGASIARCCIAPSELLPARVNQHVAIIRPKLNYIDTNFLAYLFISKEYKNALLNTGEKAGATRQALTKTQLQEFEINIPPLSEQKRIVSIVDEAFEAIDTAIDNTKQNLTNARELSDSYLNDIFTQKGEGWVDKQLGDVCDFLNGFAFKSDDAVNDSDVQLIRMGNLYKNILDLERKPAFYPNEFRDIYTKYILLEGDLVMSLTGTVDKFDYGYTVEIPKNEKTLLLNQRIVKFININGNYINKRFFLYLLRSKLFMNALYGSSRGVRQANLSSLSMKAIWINLPPVALQKSLVSEFRTLEFETQRLEAIYRKKLTALNELKQSILHKAFTGELTADQAKLWSLSEAEVKTNIKQEAIAV